MCERFGNVQQLMDGFVIAVNEEPLFIMDQNRCKIFLAGKEFTKEVLAMHVVSQHYL